MAEPLICCVLLTADRVEMTARAIRSFMAQTYPLDRRYLYVYDSGHWPCVEALPHHYPDCNIRYHRALSCGTIGALRNEANHWSADMDPDMYAHFDSDDHSHSSRLAEQVALIESDPALDAVGYSDMLFWRTAGEFTTQEIADMRDGGLPPYLEPDGAWKGPGEAWLYTSTSSYLLGTSLLYRRAAWERKPFEHVNQGEDRRWLAGLRTKGVSSVRLSLASGDCKPRMVASIHGSNTSSRIDPASENFRRVPEWDAHCRNIMQLSGQSVTLPRI